MVKIKIEFENKEVEEYFTACTQVEDIAIIDVKETGKHLGKNIFDDNFIDSENNNIIYSHIDSFLDELRSQLKEVIDLKIENEFMKISYKEWKENMEKEFDEHNEKNCRIVYRYQSDYEYYHNSPEWIMYGDFCNFIRKGTEHIGPQITAKYENIMLKNNNIFKGFCEEEFERIFLDQEFIKKGYEKGVEKSKKIFYYSNMSIRYDKLNIIQQIIFNECLKQFLLNNQYNFEIIKKIEDYSNNLPSEAEIYQQIVNEMSEEEIKKIEKEMEEDLKKTKAKVKEFVKEWRRLCKKYDSFDEEGKTLDELVDMWMNNYFEVYFMEDHYDCIECDGGKKYAQHYCYNVGICPAEEVEMWK